MSSKVQERENLRNIITQWNANRLDLFELSEPNEELEFHGVMRFYFQDSGQKVATKCIRVSSTAASRDVIHTLIEKFRPDIRMLSIPEYALYEIHENGEERKLGEEEKPLLVQLNWHKDDREGRFLLRRMDEKSILPIVMDPEARSFRRKLSKREKKEKKKKEKKEKLKDIQNNQDLEKDSIAEKLYSELPETSFTRSISNPEAVMRRRRQQKLEKKLQQFRQEGGPEAGGTLRIFGETLNKDVPYKTLLLSTRESAAYVVKEILDKYGMDEEDAAHYCLVQVIIPHPIAMGGLDGDMQEYHRGSSIREYILDDDDCPLSIEKQHNRSKGILTFHIRRRPADYQPRKRKKKPKPTKGELDNGYKISTTSHHHHHHHNDVSNNTGLEDSSEKLPYLLELNPDGSDVVQGTPKKHRLYLNVTEVGSERSSSAGGQHLQLFGPNVQSRHCVIAHTEGIVTVTPSSRDAETYVNGVRIYETTILQHGVIVRIGKLHTFRFVDPLHDERRRMSPDPRQAEYIPRSGAKDDSMQNHIPSVGGPLPPGSYETTFDADGNVETVSTHSRDDRMSRKSDDLHSHRSFGREGAQSRGDNKHEPSGPQSQNRRGNEPILPAVLEFWEEGEDAFLNAVIGQIEPSQVQFKLAPTYILYMAARYRASTHYRPEASPGDRAHRLTALMIKIAGLIHQVIQDRYRDGASLAFWLANASELLHFLKQDRHVCAYTLDAQDLLAESVQLAFRSLVTCQQVELQSALPTILEDRDDLKEEEGTTADVLAVLSSAMSLLRRCRVNAALTIQLFSQLFHHINMWLFNRVILGDPKCPVNYCSALWGIRLKRRLVRIEVWAEKQGLELAADCHLSRIVQAAQLLQSPKHNPDDAATISAACFKLNSWQIKTILENYKPMPDEPPISREVAESLMKAAQSSADELARSDGREVRLEEDPDLQLPFLLPEDGYSCDIIRGVPAGMQDYLQPLLLAGLCRMTLQPSSSGYWTIYMSDQDVGRGTRSPSVQSSHQGDGEISGRGSALPPHHSEPEVVTMKLQKSNSGMGLSIVAARGVGQDKLGIYIKSVVKGGAADQDGRLQAGDQLLKVDGNSLVGISQEKAAELMTRTGTVVTLEVAKQGAIYHGLAALLSQPSPVMQRVGSQQISIHYLSLAQLKPSIIGASYNPESSGAGSKPHVSGSPYIIPSSMPLRNSKVVASQSSCNLSRSGIGLAPTVGCSTASLAPPQQWEAVQTLDRSTTTSSKQKKMFPRHPNSPFSYLNGQLPALPFRKDSLANVASKKHLENRLPPPRPKSEETLLDGRASGSNMALAAKRWPSSDLELTAGRPRSNELIPTHPKNCVCERCCPVCRVSSNLDFPEKKLYMQTNPAYGISFCELLELQNEEENGSTTDMRLMVHTPQTSSLEGEDASKNDPSSLVLDANSSNSGTHCLCTSCLGCQQRQRRAAKQEVYAYARSRGVSPITGLGTQRVHFATGTVDNQSHTGGTHPGPRRMSERDLPGRIAQDQNHIGAPRMQGSKSVPSLNSDPQLTPIPKSADPSQPHYPGPPEPHTRHKSGPAQPLSRPESTHPQYDPRYQQYGHTGNQQVAPGQPVNPPMVNGRLPQHYQQQLTPQQQQALAEERHYQNIGMYQQAGSYSQHPRQPQGYGPQGQQPVPPWPLHGSHSSLLRTDPAYHHHHHPGQSPQQSMSQSPLDRSRPLSTLVSPREQEQYVNSLNYSNTHPRPNQADLNAPTQTASPHHRSNPAQSSGTGSWPRQESQRQSVNYGHRSDHRGQHEMGGDEVDGVGHKNVIYGQVPQTDSRQRDLLRQEAKMEEMREEVRRREERGGPNMGNQANWGPAIPQHSGPIPASSTIVRQGHPSQYTTYGTQPYPGGAHHIRGPGPNSGPPPPTVPKPRPQMQQQQWPPGYDGQPDDRHVIYRDSPPPPPPPSSTHPLMQQGPPGGPSPAVSYRYGPSGYPPRPNDGTPQDGPQLKAAPHPSVRPEVPRAASAVYGKQGPNQNRMMPDVARVAQVQNQDKKDFGITSPSPWEREEKEKAFPSHLRVHVDLPTGIPSNSQLPKKALHLLRKQKLDEARRIRDREIRELESLPNRTQKQDDCLRALRLEQEFQRRAEEMSSHGDDDEDDDELLDRAENRERILRMQEDLARTRQRRLDWEQEQLQQQQMQQTTHKHKVQDQTNHQPNHNHHSKSQEEQINKLAGENAHDTEGRLRHLRLEEVNRKKELEATKEAEERLLREARRRQEEDYQSGAYLSPHKNSLNSSGPQRLDTLLTTNLNAHSDIPPALPTSPPPVEPEFNSNNFGMDSGSQRLDTLVMSNQGHHVDKSGHPPPPPERKASYDPHNASHTSVRYTGVLRNGDVNHPPPTMQKKVSFHDARLETEINERKSSLNNDSYTLDDIDEGLDLGNQVSSASLVLNTSGQSPSSVLNTSTGSTPGVIGAQEVYRDPRQRIEAERYHSMGNMSARNAVGPEKLSFREKMKMFALETGQDETPKDKVKISRAQREIETKTTNNGAVAPQS